MIHCIRTHPVCSDSMSEISAPESASAFFVTHLEGIGMDECHPISRILLPWRYPESASVRGTFDKISTTQVLCSITLSELFYQLTHSRLQDGLVYHLNPFIAFLQ